MEGGWARGEREEASEGVGGGGGGESDVSVLLQFQTGRYTYLSCRFELRPKPTGEKGTDFIVVSRTRDLPTETTGIALLIKVPSTPSQLAAG